MTYLKNNILGILPKNGTTLKFILVIALSLVFLGLFHSKNAQVSAEPNQCNVAIVLDRSGSVTDNDQKVLYNQITRLFQPGGIYDERINLAFWSFSSSYDQFMFIGNYFGRGSTSPKRPGNYDAPFHDFVSSRGENADFNSALGSIVSYGSTNYEQGFGYDDGVANSSIDSIVKKTNLIAFLTDGQPNTPAADPIGPARRAVLKHRAAGRDIIGGMIGADSTIELKTVINGSPLDENNIFKVSANYSDLASNLKKRIENICDKYKDYSLEPAVGTNKVTVMGGDSVNFNYSVNSVGAGVTSDATDWIIRRLVVDPSQSADPLYYLGDPYRDNYGCSQLLGLVNNKASCQDVVRGNRTFNSGNNKLSPAEVGAANTVVIDKSWQPGSKVCYILALKKPTNQATPVDRHSRAACVTIGSPPAPVASRPYLKVFGGDVYVGGDIGCTIPADPNAEIRTEAEFRGGSFVGSSTDLAATAMGAIDGFYSASLKTNGPPKYLTFANTELSTYGGSFNSPATNQRCVTDYFARLPNGLQQFSGSGVDTDTLSDNAVYYFYNPGGTFHIKGTKTLVNLKIFVQGDVLIESNIKVGLLSASGKIGIANNVLELRGVFGARGSIDTCVKPGSGNTFSSGELWNNCGGTSGASGKLTIHGKLAAQKILLHRTYGDLKLATANEAPGSSNASELIIWDIGVPEIGNPSIGGYDSILGLPPVF